MRTKIVLLAVFCILLTGLLNAQDKPQRDPNKKMPSPEEMVTRDIEELKTELTLTDDQIPYIQKVLLDSYTKMQKIFQTDPPDFSQMKAIMDERDENVKLVLTDEQVKKYTDYREKQREKFRQQRENR